MIPKLSRIDHLPLYVSDRALALEWYEKMLGFRAVNISHPGTCLSRALTMANGSGSIHLAIHETNERRPGTIAFGCNGTDFLFWKERFTSIGLEPNLADHSLSWSFQIQDPFSNRISFTCHEHGFIRNSLSASGELRMVNV